MFKDIINFCKLYGPRWLSERLLVLDAEHLTTQFRIISRQKYPPLVASEGPETVVKAQRLVMEEGKNGLYSLNEFSYLSSEYSGTASYNPNPLGRKLKAIWNGGYPDGEYTREEAIKKMQEFDLQYSETHEREDLKGIPLYTSRIVPPLNKTPR